MSQAQTGDFRNNHQKGQEQISHVNKIHFDVFLMYEQQKSYTNSSPPSCFQSQFTLNCLLYKRVFGLFKAFDMIHNVLIVFGQEKASTPDISNLDSKFYSHGIKTSREGGGVVLH